MNSQQARKKLENAALALQSWGGERGEQLLEEFLAAADAYGDARELKGLDAAEAAYAQNYDGANEGDAVAMAIEAIRTRIKSGHD